MTDLARSILQVLTSSKYPMPARTLLQKLKADHIHRHVSKSEINQCLYNELTNAGLVNKIGSTPPLWSVTNVHQDKARADTKEENKSSTKDTTILVDLQNFGQMYNQLDVYKNYFNMVFFSGPKGITGDLIVHCHQPNSFFMHFFQVFFDHLNNPEVKKILLVCDSKHIEACTTLATSKKKTIMICKSLESLRSMME